VILGGFLLDCTTQNLFTFWGGSISDIGTNMFYAKIPKWGPGSSMIVGILRSVRKRTNIFNHKTNSYGTIWQCIQRAFISLNFDNLGIFEASSVFLAK
jgi:hypothetical protein